LRWYSHSRNAFKVFSFVVLPEEAIASANV